MAGEHIQTRSKEAISGWLSTIISVFSVLIALVSLVIAIKKDSGEELAKATRDWQKGFVFAALLASPKPLAIGEIEKAYSVEASKVRDKYNLKDKNFSREEIYSVLLEMLSTQAIKLPDSNTVAPRTDDDAVIDRRLVFEMIQFALAHEFQYGYSEFALEFANSHLKEAGLPLSKDKAIAVLLMSMQSNFVGMAIKPGDTIKCIGETPPLFVASAFALRAAAPAMLPMPVPCPPRKP